MGAPHASDWLFALPIAACGLRLDDEAVRVAVSLRLGVKICEPHECRCGSMVKANGPMGFVVPWAREEWPDMQAL